MDPLGDSTDSDGKSFQCPGEDDTSDLGADEPYNISIARSVCLFLNDGPSEKESSTESNDDIFKNRIETKDYQNLDPLSDEVKCPDVKQDEAKSDPLSVEVKDEAKYEPVDKMELDSCEDEDVVVKTEPEWENEEFNIVDDHLHDLSNCPRKRVRELKLLLKKETEEQSCGHKYSLRQRTHVNRGENLASKSDCEGDETAVEVHKGDIWSDDSDCDPDYAPSDHNSEGDHKISIKYKRRLRFPVKKTFKGRKLDSQKYVCLFCKIGCKDILEHLLTEHANEPEVQNISSLPLESEDRKDASAALLSKLKNYNVEIVNSRQNVKTEVKSGYKKRSKKHCCFYCKKHYRLISRHIIRVHRNEPFVERLKKFSKGSKERKDALKIILNKGNFAYNQEVRARGVGTIISKRTQNGQDKISNFESCRYCLGFFKKETLKIHEERCPLTYGSKKVFEDFPTNIVDYEKKHAGFPNEPEVQNMISLPSESKDVSADSLHKLKNENKENNKEQEKNKENVNIRQNLKRYNGTEAKKGSMKKRSWSKIFVCFYCKKKLIGKISNHLISRHRNEPFMRRLIRLPKGSEERKRAFNIIVNKGNFSYNQEIIASGEGSIISKKTQDGQDQIFNFASCCYCLGFYKKGYLKRHEDNCSSSLNHDSEKVFDDFTKDIVDVEEQCKKLPRQRILRRRIKPLPVNCKVNACFYCKERVLTIRRHLLIYHSNKPYIKHLLTLPLRSEERKTAWTLIRNKGNFMYNKEVITKGKGQVISFRRPKGRYQMRNVLPCNLCLGFYNKKTLQAHIKSCSKVVKSKLGKEDDTNCDVDIDPSDCSPVDIIQNLVKGNFVGEECDVDLKIRKKVSKKTACYYCSKLTTQLVRHLQIFHRLKTDVKYVLSLKKGSRERYNAIQAIRRKGNFLFNKALLTEGGKPTLITRRMSENTQRKYFPCEYCFGFFTLNSLVKHVYNCEKNTMSDEAKKKLSESKMKREIYTFSSTLLNCSFNSLNYVDLLPFPPRDTKIKLLALNDKLITKYGVYQLERGKMSTRSITRKMFSLAKLVEKLNVFQPSITNLFDSLHADVFKTFLKAALLICVRKNEKVAAWQESSLKTSVRHCCMIAKSDSLFQRDDTSLNQINDFLTLLTEHWSMPLMPMMLEAKQNTENEGIVNGLQQNEEVNSDSIICAVKKEFVQDSLAEGQDQFVSTIESKRNNCLFCNKFCFKLVSHWTSKHPDEPEIKKLTNLKKFTKERKTLIFALTNKGNYLHNKRVLQSKQGCYVMHGRAVLGAYSDYYPCEFCLGLLSIKNIPKHFRCCPLNPLRGQRPPISRNKRKIVQTSLMTNEIEKESSIIKFVIDKMKNDDLKHTIEKDDLIIKYGKVLVTLESKCQRFMPEASNQLRDLAKILSHCQKNNGDIKALTDCFQPEHFSHVLVAVKEMSFSKPSLSLCQKFFAKLKKIISTCCLIMRNEFILKNDETKLNNLNDCEVMLSHCKFPADEWSVRLKTTENDNENKLTQGSSQTEDGVDSEESVHSVDSSYDFSLTNKYNRYKKKGLNREWKKEENDAVMLYFSKNIENGYLPSKSDCIDCIKKNQRLNSRGWVAVKSKINNIIKSKQRNDQACSGKNVSLEITDLDVSNGHGKDVLTASDSVRNKRHISKWTNAEVKAVLSYFSKNIRTGKPPSKIDYLDCIEEIKCLKSRSWVSVKSKVCDAIRSNKDTKTFRKKGKSSENITSKRSFLDLSQSSDDESDSSSDLRISHKKKRSQNETDRQPWTIEENKAIEIFFKDHINNYKVPGKTDCEKCIRLNECLALRSWVVVKSKVHNMITTKKRRML